MNDLSMTSKTTRSSIYSYSSKISLDGVTRSSYSRGDQNSTDPPMLEAKINRKRAEGDLQILTNRIALLRTEELKALERITETQVRAKEILLNKRQNENDTQRRYSAALQNEVAVKLAQSRAAADRQSFKSRVYNSRKSIEDSKRAYAAEKKIESRKHDDMYYDIRVQEEVEKRKKADEEKRRKETLRCQREKDREEKSRITLNNYVMRIDVERLKTAETDDLINRMGGEERELIERLKRAQELQNQVSDLL